MVNLKKFDNRNVNKAVFDNTVTLNISFFHEFNNKKRATRK